MLATPHLNLLNKFLFFVLSLALLAGLVVVPSFADSFSDDYISLSYSSGTASGGTAIFLTGSSHFSHPLSGYYYASSSENFGFTGVSFSDITYTQSPSLTLACGRDNIVHRCRLQRAQSVYSTSSWIASQIPALSTFL